MLNRRYHRIRLILGDQLNRQHSWFNDFDDGVLYLIAELKQEATYTRHHIQKLCAFFSAMAIFAQELRTMGHHVLHLTLDDTAQFDDLNDLIMETVKRFSAARFQYQRPDEYRLLHQLDALHLGEGVQIDVVDSEHFLLPFNEISDYVEPGRHNLMEFFYRKMRRRFGFLMDKGQPLGGQWNFDADNRDKIKPSHLHDLPGPLLFSNDIREYVQRIKEHKIDYLGYCDNSLLWPVSRDQALQLLSHFCSYCLPLFGRFQDAMTCQHPSQWTLYHSRLSFALNAKIVSPREVIVAAIDTYANAGGAVSLPQVEGFVRQILGWREYVRCVYWVNMPHYRERNQLNAGRDLPRYFWDGNTNMNCVKHAIEQSLHYAYAHHIQRLMITGNFCLLTGVDPDQVDAWYLGIYIDAIEWVEMPNTRGMSQFADGGWIATKPYAAGGNYVNKMSDYCQDCYYAVNEKFSERACPLNSLYWYFMIQHREVFANNPRVAMVYRGWDKQNNESRQATLARARWCLEHVETL